MENENKSEETRPDTVRKRLRGIIRFVFLFLLVVSLVWVVLTIAVWISFGPTTSADDEGMQAYHAFRQDVLKPLEEKYDFEGLVFLLLHDDGVFELGLKIAEQDRMIEVMREIHALKTRSPAIDKMAVDVTVSCVSPRETMHHLPTPILRIRTVMPGESGYTGKPARSTDVRIWNETGEKFFPQDKLFAPDGASDEIEAFIRSILNEPRPE
jgi:hypothetical protein